MVPGKGGEYYVPPFSGTAPRSPRHRWHRLRGGMRGSGRPGRHRLRHLQVRERVGSAGGGIVMASPSPARPQPTEKAIQAGIVRILRQLGASVYDTSQPHRALITAGLPDLLVFHRGRFAFVEVKRPGGRLTPAQVAFQAEARRAGLEALVWTAAEEAVEWARAPERPPPGEGESP